MKILIVFLLLVFPLVGQVELLKEPDKDGVQADAPAESTVVFTGGPAYDRFVSISEERHKVEAIELSNVEKASLAAAEAAVRLAETRLAQLKRELRKAYGETDYVHLDADGFPAFYVGIGCGGGKMRMTEQLVAVSIERDYAIVRKSQQWCGSE